MVVPPEVSPSTWFFHSSQSYKKNQSGDISSVSQGARTLAELLWNSGKKERSCGALNAGFITLRCLE